MAVSPLIATGPVPPGSRFSESRMGKAAAAKALVNAVSALPKMRQKYRRNTPFSSTPRHDETLLGISSTTPIVGEGDVAVNRVITPKCSPIPLTQTPGLYQFLGEGSYVTFTRDARNQVTGFKLTTALCRNVRFDRGRNVAA